LYFLTFVTNKPLALTKAEERGLKACIKRQNYTDLKCRFSWWRSIVVRTSGLAGELSVSCARLMDGCLTTLWVRRTLSVN